VGAGVSGGRRRWSDGRVGRWTFWKFNWLAKHKILRALERTRTHARGELLDVGCGSMPFASLFAGRVTRYWGTDLNGSPDLGDARPVAYARAEAQPFRGGSFDTIVGLAMITYVPEPERVLTEAHRLLRPGGVLLMEFTQMAPIYPLHVDYWRFTRYGAEHLLRRAGFEPVEFVPVGGLWARVGLSLIAPLNRLNRGPARVLTEIPVRALYVLIQLTCELGDRLFLDPDEVLAHLVVARRLP
jgi:SAM-dependent methyltransferase